MKKKKPNWYPTLRMPMPKPTRNHGDEKKYDRRKDKKKSRINIDKEES